MSQVKEGQLTDEKLKPGELTQEQLALLNNLMYLKDITDEENKNKTLGKYLEKYKNNNYEKINNLPEGAADTSHEDWEKIIDTVSNDEKLANMKITSTIDKDDKGAQAICVVDENYPNQATVVFRGTADYEWLDNGSGGYLEETVQQERAKEWVDSLSKDYTSITSSGHSKGGNKAEFVHILCDRVTRSVSFDEPGFGVEFYEKYKDEIEAKRDSSISIAAQGDYVNILFFSVAGTKIFAKSDNTFIDRLTNSGFSFNASDDGTIGNAFKALNAISGIIKAGQEHCPTTFLTFEGGVAKLRDVAEQDPAMKLLHEYVIYVTKYATVEDREFFFEYLMNQLQGKEQKLDSQTMPEGFKERYAKLTENWIDTLNMKESDKAKLRNLIAAFIENGTLTKSQADELNAIILNINNTMSITGTPTVGSSIVRDFSETARQRLIDAIKDVEGDNPLNYQRWAQWDAVDDFIRSKLNIDEDFKDINTYYEYLIEKNNTSITKINEIFNVVYELDSNHGKKIKEETEKLKALEQSIIKLTESFDISKASVVFK